LEYSSLPMTLQAIEQMNQVQYDMELKWCSSPGLIKFGILQKKFGIGQK
jgi:hypothetical protein